MFLQRPQGKKEEKTRNDWKMETLNVTAQSLLLIINTSRLFSQQMRCQDYFFFSFGVYLKASGIKKDHESAGWSPFRECSLGSCVSTHTTSPGTEQAFWHLGAHLPSSALCRGACTDSKPTSSAFRKRRALLPLPSWCVTLRTSNTS